MIISSFSSLIEGVLNTVKNEETNKEKNSVNVSVPKEKFNEFINTFNVKDFILPTEDEAKKSYEIKKDGLNKFSLRMHLDILVNFDSKNIYRISNNDFDYMGSIEFLCGHDIGVAKSTMDFFNAVYYSYVYLKKPIGQSKSNLDNLIKISINDYVPKLKKRFQDIRQLLGRLSLYEEAFKILNMNKDLELCESNKEDAIKVFSIITFLIKLIEQENI